MKLRELGTIITGNTPSKNNKEFYNSNDIPFFKPSDFSENVINELNVSEEHISESARKSARILPNNTVLITCIGTIGKVGILKQESTCNQQINAIITNEKVMPEYLCYLLLSKKKYLQKKANAPVVPIINKTDFSNIEVSIHNINDQELIVKKLNRISKLINSRKIEIEKLNELIKSKFVEMFQSGNYPKDELGKLCVVKDGTHDSPKYLEESQYKFITSKNIINNEIDFSECKYISKQDYDRFNTRSKVNYGDILMPMIGTIGNPIIVNIPDEKIDFAIKNVALIKFLDNSKVANVYIKSLFDSDYFEKAISKNKRGGTQKFIALSDIRKLKIEIPPIEEQNKFAKFVEKVNKQKSEFEESLKKLEEMQSALMQEYFG